MITSMQKGTVGLNKLLLIGAGHAHLFFLKQLQKTSLSGAEITLLHPFEHQYLAEMFSGYAEDVYQLDDIRMDVRRLTNDAGVSWIKEAAVSIDPDQKAILTDGGQILDYDAVSFNIGALTSGTDLQGVLEYAEMVKPNARFPDAVDHFRQSLRPVIIGTDRLGVEMAMALQTWRNRHHMAPLTLIGEGGVLEDEPDPVTRKMEKLFRQKGIDFHLHDKVKAVMENKIITTSNRKKVFDSIMWLAGPKPHQLFASSALPVDQEGYLSVAETLQVKSYPSVFGVGDCASIHGCSHKLMDGLAKINQAAVLWENISGFFGEGEGRLYQPGPPRFSVLSAGDRKGLLWYKGNVFYGKWPWLIKQQGIRRLLKYYR